MADHKYIRIGKLILVKVCIWSQHRQMESEFILDTGATLCMIDPSITDFLGYSARDASRLSTVSSVLGKERGYCLHVASFETLGQHLTNFEVACHDLKDHGVEGLIGMDFLERFRWCVDPQRQMIAIGE